MRPAAASQFPSERQGFRAIDIGVRQVIQAIPRRVTDVVDASSRERMRGVMLHNGVGIVLSATVR
jgi:hypothetical protein